MGDKSTLNLLGIFSLKCSVKSPSTCLQCESCKLIDKVNCTKTWFTSLGYKNKKLFLEQLICYAPDLMSRLPSILYSLHGKDYQYAKSSLKPSNVGIDDIQNNTNHSLDISKIEGSMVDYLSWFKSVSEWTRSNYLLILLQLCGTQLLDSIKEFVIKHTDENVYNSSYSPSEDRGCDNNNNNNNVDYLFKGVDLINRVVPKCKSAPPIRDRDKHNLGSRNRVHSARERVLFDDEVQFIDIVPENVCGRNIPSVTNTNSRLSSMLTSKLSPGSSRTSDRNTNSRLSSMSTSKLSQGSSRLHFCPQSSSSARCTPVIPSISLSDMGLHDDMEINSLTTRSVNTPSLVTNFNFNNAKDFFKYLPIHIAKKIFGYLDKRSLKVACCVNSVWKELGKQVKNDVIYIQARKEDVMLMQSSGAKTPHSCYARHVPVFIPKLNRNGNIQVNTEAKHIDVEVLFDEFADINMESCYDDGHNVETETVVMEERNVYCSSYNVLMLESRHDVNRHIHYDGGDRITFGSSDRKIHVINVNTGDRLKNIRGHSASIKCLYLDEENNNVISGSYDTTIRLWDLKTGRCKLIFIGHQGTIVCLTISKQLLISTAGDCNIKIWNLSTGRCITTLSHSSVIKTLKIHGDQIIAGSSNGNVICWDRNTYAICKTFVGHKGSVTCLWCNSYFIFSGSSDGFVKLWNNVGNLNTCLKTFRHPSEVLCLEVSFCRLITGCFDGKIRIWNMLNGNCLRVIRGNSKNDPISYLFASADRLVVNTVSSILVYNFESVNWNYSVPREQVEVSSSMKLNTNAYTNEYTNASTHAFTRAQKLIYYGSPLHKVDANPSSNEAVIDNDNRDSRNNFNTKDLSRISEIKSAPLIHRPPYNKAKDCGMKKNRIKSAPSASRKLSSVDEHISRIKSATLVKRRNGWTSDRHVSSTVAVSKQNQSKTIARTVKIYDLKGTCIKENNSNDNYSSSSNDNYTSSSNIKPTVRIRCRSAPVQRVITLPPSERGASTSSFTLPINTNKRMILKVPNTKKLQRPRTAIPHASSAVLKDLKLRTFHSQLKFEEGTIRDINGK